MSDEFVRASESLSCCAVILADAAYYAAEGDGWAKVYAKLDELRAELFDAGTLSTILGMKDTLAGVSDGIVKHYGLGGTLHSYASAHEAVAATSLHAYNAFTIPFRGTDPADFAETAARVIADRADILDVNNSHLQALLRRERAKLLAAAPKPEPAEQLPPVTADDAAILKFLLAKRPKMCFQVEIEADTDISSRTVRERLKCLREKGLTHRPGGERKGETLTDEGVKLANRLNGK